METIPKTEMPCTIKALRAKATHNPASDGSLRFLAAMAYAKALANAATNAIIIKRLKLFTFFPLR